MAYTFPWDEAFPPGTQSADQINEDLQRILVQTRERLADILGVVFPNDIVTTATASKLVLKGSATSKIIPGVTSHSIRNNADSADNLLINDNGNVIPRNNIGNSNYSLISSANQGSLTLQATAGGNVGWVFSANTSDRLTLTKVAGSQIFSVDPAGPVTFGFNLIVSTGGLTISAGGATISGNTTISSGHLVVSSGSIMSSTSGTVLAQTAGATVLIGTGGANSGFREGVGFNASFDGTNWITKFDGANSGGALILSEIGTGDLQFFVIPTSGGNQSISNATLNSNNKRITISNSGIVTITGNVLTVTGTGTVNVTADGANLNERGFKLQTAGTNRWFIYADAINEAGANTGSNFAIRRYDDTSVSLGNIVTITRSTGLINLNGPVVITNNTSPTLQVSKDSSANNFYISLLNTQATGKDWRFVIDTVVAGGNFGIWNFTDSGYGLQISPALVVTIGSQTTYPSAKFTDGANTLEMGWTGNIFFFKQTQVTDRSLVFRNHSNQDVMTVGYSSGEITAGVGVFNTAVGYRINSLAPSGQYLRGNGTNAVFNTIQAGDLPTTLTPTILTIGGGQNISRVLSNSLTWNPGTITSNSQNATTVTVTGAQVGDTVWISNIWLADNIFAILQAWVSALNTVTVQITNHSAGSITLTNRTVKVWVVG